MSIEDILILFSNFVYVLFSKLFIFGQTIIIIKFVLENTMSHSRDVCINNIVTALLHEARETDIPIYTSKRCKLFLYRLSVNYHVIINYVAKNTHVLFWLELTHAIKHTHFYKYQIPVYELKHTCWEYAHQDHNFKQSQTLVWNVILILLGK